MRSVKYKTYARPMQFPVWPWGESRPAETYWIEPVYGMLLGPPIGWEYQSYGFFPFGRFDGCWRLGLAVMAYPELRDTFYNSLMECQTHRLRYLGPVEYRRPGCKKPLHPYYTFSRDARIMGMAGLLLSGEQWSVSALIKAGEAFDQPLNPRYSMRPGLKYWLRYLESGKQADGLKFHKYLALDLQLFGKPNEYSLHLISWMLYCCPNAAISELLLTEYIPEWNLLLRMLNHDFSVTKEEVMAVQSWNGFQWQHYEEKSLENTSDYKLIETERFRLDVDVLRFIYNRENPDQKVNSLPW